jgi:nitrogen fixation protein FixH
MSPSQASPRRGKELTGRTVLVSFIVFFGVVFAANAVLVRAAVSTFGGVVSNAPYKAGLLFEKEITAAHDQDARHWRVEGHLARSGNGETQLDIKARDANGAPLSGITFTGKLEHPADSKRDHVIEAREVAPGLFRAYVRVEPGQWDLVVDLSRDDQRLFRSKSRLSLR